MFSPIIYAIVLVSGQFPEQPSAFSETGASMMQPTGNEKPLSPISSAKVESAAVLLRGALSESGERPLDGQSVKLAEILSKVSGRQARMQVTRAYWQLAKSAAAHRFGVQETDFLFGLAVPQSAHQQAVLTSTQASVKAEETRARLDALRAQYALAAASGLTPDSDLPLPADVPFVGVYETRFETLQSRGLPHQSLAQIHATLPVLCQVLERQADAVYAADAALRQLHGGYHAGQVPLSSVLDGFERLRKQRREFLASVLEYNESIAEYALAVASPQLPVDRVVGMLIEVPDGQRSVLASRRDQGAIRRVTNEAPIDNSPDGWTDRAPRLDTP